MALAVVYVDAKGAVRDWINAQTVDLVGAGRPLVKGAYLQRLRSPADGCYALLSLVGGSPELTPERPWHRARVSAQIYGPTQEATDVAAAAYANAVASLRGVPVVMGSASCLCADGITGPLDAKDADEYRVVVDADFYLSPAA
jgi:hypothetical protein